MRSFLDLAHLRLEFNYELVCQFARLDADAVLIGVTKTCPCAFYRF
jgi:hypothetical protein